MEIQTGPSYLTTQCLILGCYQQRIIKECTSTWMAFKSKII